MTWSRTVGYAAAGLAGIIASAGTLISPVWFITPLGLGIFFFILWKKATNVREAALYGCIFGFVTAGAGLLSLLEIVPAHPASANGETFLATLLLWLVPTIALGAVTALPAILIYAARTNVFAPFIAVLAWIVNDELRMWAWMLVTYGPGAATEPHLSITALGYALADNPYLLQLAQGGGLLFLTITVALIASVLASIPDLRNRSRVVRMRACLTLLVTLLIVSIPLFQKPETNSGTTQRVALFSTTIGMDVPNKTSALLEKIATTPAPDVVVLPEGKALETIFKDSEKLRRLQNAWFADKKDVLIIHSAETADADGARHNTVLFDSSRSGPLAHEYKQFLMPEGEYLPYLSTLFLSWLPNSSLANITDSTTVMHGNERVAVPFGNNVFGALLCSEVFSPSLYRALVTKQGATVLVNLGDPQWFRGSHLLFNKTVQIAKVHAVQNRAYFLAAENAEPAFIIDPHGTLVAQTSWGTTDVLLFDLPIAPH